jgi:hypothetical protein
MTTSEYFDYHYKTHGRLSTAPTPGHTPTIYLQTHFFDSVYSSPSPAHPWYFGHNGVTELYFDDLAHVAKTFSSDHVRTVVGPDGANFSDGGASICMFSREEAVFGAAATSEEGVVAKYALQGRGDVEDGTELAAKLKEHIVAAFGACSSSIVVDVRVKDELGILGYFGSKDAPAMSLVYTVYLKDKARSIPAFREALRSFKEKVDGLINKEVSFVCFGKRAVVFDSTEGKEFDPSHQPDLTQIY